jgi:dihydrofolate reductase
MTTGHVYIATSLDGFIARPDGSIDWLTPFGEGEDDLGYAEFMADKQAIIMGRGTYETVLTFGAWPYTLPVLVLSRSLTSLPDRLDGMAEVADLSPLAAMRMCTARGWDRVYVDGGALVQSFLRAGLIADMIVTRVPVLLGQGRPLFGPLKTDIALTHEGTRSLPGGLVQSRYSIA